MTRYFIILSLLLCTTCQKIAIDYRTPWIGNYKAKIYYNSSYFYSDTISPSIKYVYTTDSTQGYASAFPIGDSSILIKFLSPLNWDSSQSILSRGSFITESLKDNYIMGRIDTNGILQGESTNNIYKVLSGHFNSNSASLHIGYHPKNGEFYYTINLSR